MWERPTEHDMTHCAGCGKHDSECDGECEEYRKLVVQAMVDESQGVFLPSYCGATNEKFCTKCGKVYEGINAVCVKPYWMGP